MFEQHQIERDNPFKRIVGKNAQMRQVFQLMDRVAPTKTTVLIEGESGTGKELVAQAIHQISPRAHQAFVKVNCGVLAEGVLESELFGHIKGAFTGAIANKLGRFELADKGTVFLDEIGDMSPNTQVKLLRVLQEGEFERVGGIRPVKVDVRIIAATNRDLKAEVASGRFREDLYYRLKVVPLRLPPLRARKDDLPLLIDHFLEKFRESTGKEIRKVSSRAMEILLKYDYPGNVRELENIIEHAFVCCQGETISPEDLPQDVFHASTASLITKALKEDDPLGTLERELLLELLTQHYWQYQRVAEKLKISRTTLWRKLKQLGISRPEE